MTTLAITYLGRHDLAHVEPEDLRGDALHNENDHEPEFESEEVIAEHMVEPRPVVPALTAPRSGHLHPLPENGRRNGNGHKLVVNRLAAGSLEQKIRLARLKGTKGTRAASAAS